MKESLWAVCIDECLLVDRLPYVILAINTFRKLGINVSVIGRVVEVNVNGERVVIEGVKYK